MVEIIEFPIGEAMKEKTVTQEVKINPEFEKLIRPLDKEEFEGLEEQILAWGSARDPLVIWNGYLVDGHHRYAICTKHGLPFNTVNGKFEDEDDVLVFIINNQIKKRNLNDFEKASYIVLLKKILARKEAKERQKRKARDEDFVDHHGGRQKDKIDGRVDRILAKEAGVSHKTISQVSKILDHASEETKQKLKEGKLSVRKAYKDIKREEVSQESNFPKGQYRIIHADPYLRDNTLPCGWNMKSLQFNPSNLPVKENLDPDDAVLFLWTPPRYIDYSFSLMKDWGFAYRRMFIWDHCKYFDNDYMSETHHLILLCTKFDCPPDTDTRPISILHDTGEGSRYDQFSKVIESLYSYGDKLELFMDQEREGWDLFRGIA